MKKHTRQQISALTLVTQVLLWVIIVMLGPITNLLTNHSVSEAISSIPGAFSSNFKWILLYFMNYLWLVPKGLFNRKVWLFAVCNLAFMAWLVVRVWIASMAVEFPDGIDFTHGKLIALLATLQVILDVMLVFLAIGASYTEQYFIIREQAALQQQKATEAELVWLRNQLNPHFLFNTLNTISSLTRVDPDKAQDSIAELSDVLRYALYETSADLVPLDKEISFMKDYIDLMSLRFGETADITCEFNLPAEDIMIAPLLFISLIENAFKHGVNSRGDSFVRIRLSVEDGSVLFTCENSVFGKQAVDRSGSGIGLENLKKRLELLYPGRYEYSAGEDSGVYKASIKLSLK